MELCNATQLWMTNMNVMLALLEAEFLALKEKENAHINRMAQEKEALLLVLSKQEIKLLDAAYATGFTGEHLITHLSAHCGAETAEAVRTVGKQVQQANQRNGALLQAMIRLNEHALRLLTGKQPKMNIYGASGQLETSVSQLTKLATA
jgi:flagella synthesis protein FlgN